MRPEVILMALTLSLPALAGSPPAAPEDTLHPGSLAYAYGVEEKNLKCDGRDLDVFLPVGVGGKFPLVVFGHGQALGVSSYRATFEHLAKKGIGVAFPAFDNGFFDQDWARMGRDFVNLADCAVRLAPDFDPALTVYAGHSKGAYVASIAAGLVTELKARTSPKAIVLFEPAGADSRTLPKISADSALTVVFSDRDTVVSRSISEKIFAQAGSSRRQFIFLKSYAGTIPTLFADHMWPLSEKSFFGGGPVGSLHYFGSWKWLVAAAQDLRQGAFFDDPYLYGELATDKGIAGLTDDIKRTW